MSEQPPAYLAGRDAGDEPATTAALPPNLADLERRARHCLTHHAGCDCREYRLTKAEADRDLLMERVATLAVQVADLMAARKEVSGEHDSAPGGAHHEARGSRPHP